LVNSRPYKNVMQQKGSLLKNWNWQISDSTDGKEAQLNEDFDLADELNNVDGEIRKEKENIKPFASGYNK